MKTAKILIVLFLFACCINRGVAQSSYDERVGNAINTSNWYELKQLYDNGADSIHPMLKSFAKAMIEHNFGTPDNACSAIDELVNTFPDEIGVENVINMTFLKAAHLTKVSKYKEAAQIVQNLTANYDMGQSADLFNLTYRQYLALDSIGDINKITAPEGNISIPFELDTIMVKNKPFYAIMLNATANNTPIRILFDSGAGVNVVSEKTAALLGANRLNLSTRAAGFGGVVKGGYATIDKIELGNMAIKNVPFQVFDITSGVDSIDRKMTHLDIILGVDFMNLVDELHIDFKNSQLVIPAQKTHRNPEEIQNFYGGTHGLFFIMADINGTLLETSFDTGATSSTLCHKYYERYKEYIESTCEVDTLRQAGAGGIKIEKAYKMKDVNVSVNGVSYTFPEIKTSTEPDFLEQIYANLGMDYFTQFSRIIFNRKERFVRLEK